VNFFTTTSYSGYFYADLQYIMYMYIISSLSDISLKLDATFLSQKVYLFQPLLRSAPRKLPNSVKYRKTRNVGQCPINVMAALPNIGGALCSTPQSLADAQY